MQQIGSRVYHREYGPGTVLYMGSTIKVSNVCDELLLQTSKIGFADTLLHFAMFTVYTLIQLTDTRKDDIPNVNRWMWYGIRLDAATGDSDGSMPHPASKATIVKYFQAKPNHAIFCLRYVRE